MKKLTSTLLVATSLLATTNVANAETILLTGTFTSDLIPTNADSIYAIRSDGTFTTVISGIDGLESTAFGPGGSFGSSLYIATAGTSFSGDGGVFTLNESGSLSPFLTNLDAFSIAFDTENILGGGMYVSDINSFPSSGEPAKAGKIWRVLPEGSTPLPDNPTLSDPDSFKVELFSDLSLIPTIAKAYQIKIHDGSSGFPSGIYATAPFNPNINSLIYIDPTGIPSVLIGDLENPESLLFAKGEYGSGILFSEFTGQRISRLLPDGNISTFATIDIPNFRPTFIEFGSDGYLYVNDGPTGSTFRIFPDGGNELVSTIPIDNIQTSAFRLYKSATCAVSSSSSSFFSPCVVPEPTSTIAFISIGILGITDKIRKKAKK